MVTVLIPTARAELATGEQAGADCSTAHIHHAAGDVPDADWLPSISQKSLNKYSRHLLVLRERAGLKKKISPLPDWLQL